MSRVQFSQVKEEISKRLTNSAYGDEVYNRIASFEQEGSHFTAAKLNELRTQYSQGVRAYATLYFGLKNSLPHSRIQAELDERAACQDQITNVSAELRDTLSALKMNKNFIHHHITNIQNIVSEAIDNTVKAELAEMESKQR